MKPDRLCRLHLKPASANVVVKMGFPVKIALVGALLASVGGPSWAGEQIDIYRLNRSEIENFSATSAPLTVDVVWCDGDAWAEQRKSDSVAIASSISTLAKLRAPKGALNSEVPDAFIASVRMRPISISRDVSEAVSLGRNSILIPRNADASIRATAQLISDVAGHDLDLDVSTAKSYIPNYIRVVVCRNVDNRDGQFRVFFQVATKSQSEIATWAIRGLRDANLNLNVLPSAEVVEGRAPSKSEVRFFFEEDRLVSKQIADKLLSLTGEVFAVKPLLDFDRKPAPTTIEVWFGTSYNPSPPQTLLVCEGEHQIRCPPGAAYVPCYTFDSWAGSRCSRYIKKQVTSVSGNKCGYSVSEVLCITSTP